MSSILSFITDSILKVSYRNTTEISQIDLKDDSLIVNLLSKFIIPILMIFGFYVHSHGDYTPGGGFQAGIIFACLLCLYYFININNNIGRISYNLLTYISMIGFMFYLGFGILSFCITGKLLDYTFLPIDNNNAIGVFIVEFGIALVVFSSVLRTFTVLLNLLKLNSL